MILDCSSYESTKRSLCEIFHTTEIILLSILDGIENNKTVAYDTLEREVYSTVCSSLGDPDKTMEVLWFHGTRVKDGSSFYRDGILRKSDVRDRLWRMLEQLSEGLEKKGANPFAISMSGKAGVNDEGPFAFLVKDIAIKAPGENRSYTESPELVEDIAGVLLGENYYLLVERFKETTIPLVVSFSTKPKGGEVSRALLFLKLMKDGESELEAGEAANMFFNAHGMAIPAEKIKTIDKV